MKKIYPFSIAVLLMFSLNTIKLSAQFPGSDQVAIEPEAIPQFVDFLPHFAGLRVNAKAGGNLIIEAVKTQQVAVSTGTVLDNGTVGVDPGAGVGNYFVYRVSKDGGKTFTIPLWPSFTIEAQRFKPLKVELRNQLHGLSYKDVNIAADQTLMMSGVPAVGDPMKDPYTGPIPIALHLHGGEVSSTSDGGPHAWFTPGYEMKGKGWTQGVTKYLSYPNDQESATLWYHEHSQLGLTRINVYAGMAGFYFLRGADEEIFRLPGWSKDDLVQEVTPAGKTADALHPAPYLPEIEIAIQDRMFDTKGQLFYPVEPTNPDINPFWSPEFFGDVITVNGKTWPYLSVAPRKYRFHFLDGSNARFYRMWLQNAETGAPGPAFIQIGTDGGLLDAPVVIDPASGKKLLMGPGERADLIIDFSKVPKGTVLTLMNDANAPYPDGDDVEENTTDRIMQFVVNGKMVNRVYPKLPGTDKSLLPRNLRLIPLVKLTDFRGRENIKPDVIRQLTLNEVMAEGGPAVVLLNNTRFEMMHGEGMHQMDMPGAVTEKPVEGSVEKWQLINLTMDAHPMHMHLVQFQLVGRQNFDMERYMDDYMNSFTGQNGGMAGMYMGAEGPPFDYNTKNSDGAVGGNLPVTDYLLGPMIPAEPNERGWKDVILAYPNQIMTYMVRFAPTQLPLWWPKRLSLFGFDPSKGPGYVWHCHIVEHEDNDMMRPMDVQPNPVRVNKPLDGKSIQPNILLSDKVFSLGQNYPNPFSNETEFSFTIPNDCHVTLTVLNYRGALVKTIIDSDVPAGPQYVRLTTDGLSKGTYFYRIQAGAFTATKTMIIN